MLFCSSFTQRLAKVRKLRADASIPRGFLSEPLTWRACRFICFPNTRWKVSFEWNCNRASVIETSNAYLDQKERRKSSRKSLEQFHADNHALRIGQLDETIREAAKKERQSHWCCSGDERIALTMTKTSLSFERLYANAVSKSRRSAAQNSTFTSSRLFLDASVNI